MVYNLEHFHKVQKDDLNTLTCSQEGGDIVLCTNMLVSGIYLLQSHIVRHLGNGPVLDEPENSRP